jgi:peroxiredoxin Q/BCP
MSKHSRIKRSRASQPAPEDQGWTAGSGRNRGGLAWWGVALAVAVAAAVVLVVAAGKSEKPGPAGERVSSGPAPAFSERDVSSGAPVTSDGLRGESVLLFFNEGVMCQACFEQIQSLQQRSGELRKHGLTLVNITTDPPDVLREAVQAYGIETPMISDESKDMSTAYGAIGQGMHPDTDGHTFVLIDEDGRIRWRRDYTTMFVQPDRLFAEIPKVH